MSMAMLREILEWLGENYNVLVMLLTVVAGLISFYVDRRQMQGKKLGREALWAKWIGLFYIFGGAGLWLSVQIALRVLGMR